MQIPPNRRQNSNNATSFEAVFQCCVLRFRKFAIRVCLWIMRLAILAAKTSVLGLIARAFFLLNSLMVWYFGC